MQSKTSFLQRFCHLLAARVSQWDSLRAGCVARMEELAEVFGGRQQLSRVVASKKLEVEENKTHSLFRELIF